MTFREGMVSSLVVVLFGAFCCVAFAFVSVDAVCARSCEESCKSIRSVSCGTGGMNFREGMVSSLVLAVFGIVCCVVAS